MPLVYTYPYTTSLNTDDGFLISKNDQDSKTMNVSVGKVFELIPSILDLDDFPLYGQSFGNIGSVPQPGDTLTYDGAEWIPASAGTVEREIINVSAVYDPATNVYSGNGVPPPSSYTVDVIYKVVFDTTNTSSASSLNVQALGDTPLVAPDESGVLQPVEAEFIQAGTIYYLSYLANTFQISTTPPTPTASAVEYSNSLPVSIAEDVGGVKANNNETWSPIEDPPGSGIYRGWSLEEIMNRIFYPYQNPAFTSFSLVGQTQNVEVGTTIAGGTRPFTWTFNAYADNVAASTLSINDVTSPINTGVTNPLIANASTSPQANVNIGDPIIKTQEESHKWQASALTTLDNPAGQQTINSPLFTVKWHYKWYYGASANPTLTNAQIPTLLAGVLGNVRSANVSIDATGNGAVGEYWYLAFPTAWGNLNNWGFSGNDVSTGPIGAPYNLDQGGTDGFRFYAEVTGVPVPNSPAITYRVNRTNRLQNGVSPVSISI